jgi:MYXO-CTERM domain-containing protein
VEEDPRDRQLDVLFLAVTVLVLAVGVVMLGYGVLLALWPDHFSGSSGKFIGGGLVVLALGGVELLRRSRQGPPRA